MGYRGDAGASPGSPVFDGDHLTPEFREVGLFTRNMLAEFEFGQLMIRNGILGGGWKRQKNEADRGSQSEEDFALHARKIE